MSAALLTGCVLLPDPAGAHDAALQPRPQQPSPAVLAHEAALLDAVNRQRVAAGLQPWPVDTALTLSARAHSVRMAETGRLAHDGFAQRAAATGSTACVENLARGVRWPERLLQAWQQSPSHQRNLLDAQMQRVGVGVAGDYATLLACSAPAGGR